MAGVLVAYRPGRYRSSEALVIWRNLKVINPSWIQSVPGAVATGSAMRKAAHSHGRGLSWQYEVEVASAFLEDQSARLQERDLLAHIDSLQIGGEVGHVLPFVQTLQHQLAFAANVILDVLPGA